MLSDYARSLLVGTGWTTTRRVDLTAVSALLDAEGYRLTDRQKAVIESLDGVTILFEWDSRTDSVVFDVKRAVDSWDRLWVLDYADRVGEELVPVGCAYTGHLLLVLSASGRVFGGYDDEFFHAGDSWDIALSNLVEERIARFP